MSRTIPYTLRIPPGLKTGIKLAAKRYGLTPPDFIRAVLSAAVNDEVRLKLVEVKPHDRQTPAAGRQV
jgi:hypothetical protein